ncbi:hypothetical protein EVG20_g476 [Dentipellis fragilis]|uniref:HMG box domain-containing protein n=1 Tax=Dentipellis fragilis TaxID=205917 RepID=A0A4Y9ZDI9_9AGAM|nr:hypothetical protein EVG20_g476 [Dentipellis fragilis]
MSLSSGGIVEGWRPSSDDQDSVDLQFSQAQGSYEPLSSPNAFSPTDSPYVRTTYSYSHSTTAQPSSYPVSPTEYFPSYESFDSSQTSNTSGMSSSDRRAIRNKIRDPSWVPRPRNAFIIFRCDYAREHARDVVVSSPSSSIPSDKTLSKRAAEAWKRLPVEQKEEYKGRAEREKDEHARQNPHYRFKPMRRPTSSSRGGSRSQQRSDRGEKVARLVSRGHSGSQREDTSQEWGRSISGSGEGTVYQSRGDLRRRWVVAEASQPIPVPPSCASSPGPWYGQMQGSSNGGTPQETPAQEVPPLPVDGSEDYGAGPQLEPLSDDMLFSGYTFPSSNTSYFPASAQPLDPPSGFYASSSFPGAVSQSSLLTVKPHPAASQSSLLTVRPMPGASQTSLLTLRQRPPPKPFVPGPRLVMPPRPFLPAGVSPPDRSQPFIPTTFRPHPAPQQPGPSTFRRQPPPQQQQQPMPPAVRSFPPIPQVPVLVKPHVSPLMTMGTAFNDWSFESTAQYDGQGARDDGSSSASSDASGTNTPYSSDSDAEGYVQAHHHMIPEGLPIPRPRYSPPRPHYSPPRHPPPQYVNTSPSTSMTSSSSMSASIPYHHQSWDTEAFGSQTHGLGQSQQQMQPSISVQDTDPSSPVFWDAEAFGGQVGMHAQNANEDHGQHEMASLSPTYDLRANLGLGSDFF